MSRALLFGASGLIGGHCLGLLVEDPHYERVVTVGRREIARRGPKHVHRVLDFDGVDPFDTLERADHVYCCLGTTIAKAGSKTEFRRVDFDYVVRVAKFAKFAKVSQFLLVSALGAQARSNIFYNRIKGEAEEAVLALELPALHVFRPSLLLGERPDFRWGERLAQLASRGLGPLLLGPLRNYRAIEARVVAISMLRVAESAKSGAHIYDSQRIREIAQGSMA